MPFRFHGPQTGSTGRRAFENLHIEVDEGPIDLKRSARLAFRLDPPPLQRIKPFSPKTGLANDPEKKILPIS